MLVVTMKLGDVVSLKVDDVLQIGETIVLRCVERPAGGKVRVGIEAPESVDIRRLGQQPFPERKKRVRS